MKNLFFMIISGLFIMGASFHIFGEDCDTIPNIDGMTTASSRFVIRTGIACETYAEITWYDCYNNGNEHILKYCVKMF